MHGAKAGAYIAMDPRDGAILAMGSQPGFDAGVFARPFSQQTYEDLTSQAKGAPLINRVTESAYPTGSVFKPITALAALEEGVIGAATRRSTTPATTSSARRSTRTPRTRSFGTINLRQALTVSSDVFFYHLGEWPTRRDRCIQRWAKRSGSGARPGST